MPSPELDISSHLDQTLAPALFQRQQQFRYRARRPLDSAQGACVRVAGRELTNFCSNDYLGLANHGKLREAAIAATRIWGAGSGASHLVCGHTREHHLLEEELAAFTQRPRALLFSTGYMANLGCLAALLGRFDTVYQDKLNHASLLDGGRLSGAKLRRYAHQNMTQLRAQMCADNSQRKIIAVDGVFSMDGDLAPLRCLADIAQANNAWLMVDDAHGFGCLGATGAGSVEAAGLGMDDVPILMGTLGKAIGSFGAFVAGSEALIETLIQFARTYIYTTALAPSVVAASRAGLQLIQDEPERRQHLLSLIEFFRQGAASHGLPVLASSTPIQPLILGPDHRALYLQDALAQRGFWISAIRPPTVPEGSARLRITLSAAHTHAQVEALLEAVASCWRELPA